MTMSTTSVFWLNLNVDSAGVWENTPVGGRVSGGGIARHVGGADIEILEVKVSGSALLVVKDSGIAAAVTPDVFLQINYTSGQSEFRSGPSDRAYTLSNVEEFILYVNVPVGNDAYEQVHYTIFASAHCQWSGPLLVSRQPEI